MDQLHNRMDCFIREVRACNIRAGQENYKLNQLGKNLSYMNFKT